MSKKPTFFVGREKYMVDNCEFVALRTAKRRIWPNILTEILGANVADSHMVARKGYLSNSPSSAHLAGPIVWINLYWKRKNSLLLLNKEKFILKKEN